MRVNIDMPVDIVSMGKQRNRLQYHAKSTSSNTAPMFRLYFRTILYMIGSKDNEKR